MCETPWACVCSYQAEDQPVQSDDVVLPHHVVQDLDTLVELLAPGRRGELVHQEVCKRPHVGHQRPGPDPLQHPGQQGGTGLAHTHTHTRQCAASLFILSQMAVVL